MTSYQTQTMAHWPSTGKSKL